LLDSVQVGDKVLFSAERSDGAIVVTTLRVER
jgi:Cu/Ag efflux protein CusF